MTESIIFPYELNERVASKALIGLLALSADATIEAEWRNLLDQDGVEFYLSRVENQTLITYENLEGMEKRVENSLRFLVPGTELDVIAFACTSATLVVGEEKIEKTIHQKFPAAKVTNPLTASMAAFSAFNAKSIALLTPYEESLNRTLHDYYTHHGIEVVARGSFFNSIDPEVVRINEKSIEDAIDSLTDGVDVDAVFIACTALRAAALVPKLESRLQIPVTTSNHAMAWHALHLAGITHPNPHLGRLFQL